MLGSVGLALLLYTAVSLVQKIEEAFNYIWHVSRARGIGERFSRYLSALLVGPLLVFSAMGITATAATSGVVREAMRVQAIGWLALQAGHLLPYVLVIGAFTFVYTFMPNTRVRLGPALTGGVVGGILWQSAGWAFALFAASSTRYAAIYSSFAILILFMLWLYLSWLILLFGAAVSFYIQHPEHLVARSGEPRLSNRMRERLALVMMSMIARHHLEGGAPWSTDALAHTLRMPVRAVDAVLGALRTRGILASTSDEPPAWLPARDLAGVNAKELLDAVRAAGEDRYLERRRAARLRAGRARCSSATTTPPPPCWARSRSRTWARTRRRARLAPREARREPRQRRGQRVPVDRVERVLHGEAEVGVAFHDQAAGEEQRVGVLAPQREREVVARPGADRDVGRARARAGSFFH